MGPLSYADTPLMADESTAGPSTPSAGPRRGVGFAGGCEPSPDPRLQPSPLCVVVGDKAVYGQDGSGQ